MYYNKEIICKILTNTEIFTEIQKNFYFLSKDYNANCFYEDIHCAR